MSFSKKAAEIMHTLQTDYGEFRVPANKKQPQPDRQPPKICKHNCSAVQVKISSGQHKSPNQKCSRESLVLQTPIIIEKRNHAKSVSANKYFMDRRLTSPKKVEPFIPIAVPKRDLQKYKIETTTTESTSRNKQIEIYIDKDGEDKECLKKLFKKVHSLTEELAESERERHRLQLELDHANRKDITCKQHERIINKLEGEKYKLQMQNDILKKKARMYDDVVPRDMVKELVFQKPVEVKVEVPKYIPGPQRIVQKIVEIPKYVQIEKKIPEIIIKEIKVPEVIEKQVFIEKPVYKDPIIVDKPVFVEKPIYVDRPVEVEKKVQVEVPVEIQVPVYIDRPIVDQEWIRRFQQVEDELGAMMRENQVLKSENFKLKGTLSKMQTNLDLLSSHNHEKNREVEMLLSNRGDYLPIREQLKLERTSSALDRTSSTLSPRSHRHLMYL